MPHPPPTSQSPSAVQRLRVTYGKGEAIRYVGHLDLVRTWERALRRAGVPLAYSQGFNPQARVQFASALPVGASGEQELFDALMVEPVAPDAFLAAVRPQLPAGLILVRAREVPLKGRSLQALLRASRWQVDLEADATGADIDARIERLQAAARVPASRQRKGREITYDLRPLILDLTREPSPREGWLRLNMTLRSEPSATGRPDAVLSALGLDQLNARLTRLECLLDRESP